MRRLLLAPLILALSSPVLAGIPSSRSGAKWVSVTPTLRIDTEDVDLKGSKLRFYIENKRAEGQPYNPHSLDDYVGKLRINCAKFTTKVEGRVEGAFGSYYQGANWERIRSNMYAYRLANYFCFLTGEEGYTRESIEPAWVKKIIKNVKAKNKDWKAKDIDTGSTEILMPATDAEINLYRQRAVSDLCNSRLSKVPFPKAISAAAKKYAQAVTQKHKGFVEEIPNKKLTPDQLYNGAVLQILDGAIQTCPNLVPDVDKKKFADAVKKLN